MKHASVFLDGVQIPLIGIPASATIETCDWCHDVFHIQSVAIADGEGFLCEKCLRFLLRNRVADVSSQRRRQ